MADAFYPSFDASLVYTDGKVYPLADADVYATNVTQELDLPAVTSDADGIVAEGYFAADAATGDVVEFYALEPPLIFTGEVTGPTSADFSWSATDGTIRFTLQASLADAYDVFANDGQTLIHGNLYAGETAAKVVDIYAVDANEPNESPKLIGSGEPGSPERRWSRRTRTTSARRSGCSRSRAGPSSSEATGPSTLPCRSSTTSRSSGRGTGP
jgi:hypothetical protein